MPRLLCTLAVKDGFGWFVMTVRKKGKRRCKECNVANASKPPKTIHHHYFELHSRYVKSSGSFSHHSYVHLLPLHAYTHTFGLTFGTNDAIKAKKLF